MGDEQAKEKKDELLDLDDPADSSGEESFTRPVSSPTIKPPFDPVQFAEDAIREPMPTIVDEEATEEARITSVLMDSTPPRSPSASAPDLRVKVEDALSPEEERAILEDRLAPLTQTPHLAKKLEELTMMIADSKTAFVLGFVDGLLPLETIVEVAGLPEIETLRILARAFDQGAIVFKKS
jgi:hypothetical protein